MDLNWNVYSKVNASATPTMVCDEIQSDRIEPVRCSSKGPGVRFDGGR